MVMNDTGEQTEQKAVLNPFIPRLNMKTFSLFPVHVLCASSPDADLLQSSPGRHCRWQSAKGIPSCWGVWGHLSKSPFQSPLGGLAMLNPSVPQTVFTSDVSRKWYLILSSIYLSFLKVQMLMYWLVGSAVSLLCQSLLMPNFPTRQADRKDSQILSSFTWSL